jgi:hypothetical protein
LAELADRYGLLIVVIIVLLTNVKALLALIEKAIPKVYPPWAAHRKDTREWRQGRADRSYEDAVSALQSLLEDARAELKAAGQERRDLQTHLLRHLGQYEQLAARTIAAIQDVSAVLQEQNERIAQLTERLRQANGHGQIPPTHSREGEKSMSG